MIPELPAEATPCPCCKREDRKVLAGMLCFDCEKSVAREVANDLPAIMAFLRPRLEFKDWRIEHGDTTV